MALYNYMSQILVELIKLANLIISITKSLACAGRISTVLEMPAEEDGGSGSVDDSSDIAVEFDNVSFTYDGSGESSLEGVSFKAKKGETIGIIGSTGSGKTTLVNLIPGFYRPTEGKITVGGCDSASLPLEELRSRVAVVPQRSVLFKGTVRENLRWGKPDATEQEMLAALETAQAKDFILAKAGWTPPLSRAGAISPAARGSALPSQGQSSRTRISLFLTTAQAPSTTPPTPLCVRP